MNDYFELCIEEALISYQHGDVPIGAILVKDGEVIAKGHNTREIEHNVLGHAEINVILEASAQLKRWNLADCDLYVTLEPCSMCISVIKQARIANVYYLLTKSTAKKEYNRTNFVQISKKNAEKVEQMYVKMLSDFFQSKR